MDSNITTLLVAAIGAGGLGAVIRELVAAVGKMKRGVSSRESTRKDDLVAARERAEADAVRYGLERDAENRNRRRIEAYAAQLLRELIVSGRDPGDLPDVPELEQVVAPVTADR